MSRPSAARWSSRWWSRSDADATSPPGPQAGDAARGIHPPTDQPRGQPLALRDHTPRAGGRDPARIPARSGLGDADPVVPAHGRAVVREPAVAPADPPAPDGLVRRV